MCEWVKAEVQTEGPTEDTCSYLAPEMLSPFRIHGPPPSNIPPIYTAPVRRQSTYFNESKLKSSYLRFFKMLVI